MSGLGLIFHYKKYIKIWFSQFKRKGEEKNKLCYRYLYLLNKCV